MQVNVNFLDNLRLEASFDDFTILTDQPVRYKGDGTAPSPFDYFLASSALCAAYFVKVYCKARNIPTEDIKLYQNNIVDPENRYNQVFNIQIELPESINDKDREGILKAMDRCTVKRVIQNDPGFIIKPKNVLGSTEPFEEKQSGKETFLLGKDAPLEQTKKKLFSILQELGINIEIASWRNPIPHVWSVHVRDADSPMCYTNGKGATKDAALCSALGEYLERISNNYFYNDYFLGNELSNAAFVHYPNEKWFKIESEELPYGLMDEYLKEIYSMDGELKSHHLVDMNSGNSDRGICALPYTKYSSKESIYIPVNLIGNLFVSNGMSAGNSKYEARVQALSEIFERAIKNKIILEEISLPDIPNEVVQRYPNILEGIKKLEDQGFPVILKDASLGGVYPVISVTLMNPKTGGVFASFGAHPKFEVALERSLTELLQGRSFEGLNDVPAPTFNEYAIQEHNNTVEHFIDSTGVVSWKYFSSVSDYDFVDWNFDGSTKDEFHHLMSILEKEQKEVYISDFEDLGFSACRIIVPDYSEVYQKDDLLWENHNRALIFRENILSIQKLSDSDLKELIEKLEEEEIDDHMNISELIGVAFEETSEWGQLTVSELKALISLKLNDFETAKENIEIYNAFNESTPSRKRFYQLVAILLDIETRDDLLHKNFNTSLTKMYSEPLYKQAYSTIKNETPFFGLTQTDMNCSGIRKHQQLLDSYRKLWLKRKSFYENKHA